MVTHSFKVCYCYADEAHALKRSSSHSSNVVYLPAYLTLIECIMRLI